MSVIPTEATMTPVTYLDRDPAPIFKDENLSIYAIPVFPARDAQPVVPSYTTVWSGSQAKNISLKRKRSQSPNPPVRRSNLESRSMSEPTALSEQHRPTPIHDIIKQPGFSPSLLQGDAAQGWRRFMIDAIFPGSRRPSHDKAEQRKLKEQRIASGGSKGFSGESNDGHEVDDDAPHRRIIHPGFSSQLPGFTTAGMFEPLDASLNPTLAYALVGPRVRGKFDVEKAAALGLPSGPIRSRLTRGETVSFMVEDSLGQGGMVERFVQPQECIGESESPGVSTVRPTSVSRP